MAKSIANQISPSQVSGRLANWHRVMEEAGLTYDDLQKPIDNPEFRKSLTDFWHSFEHPGNFELFEHAESQRCAREIMGKNFFGVKEAIKHFGVKPTSQQLAALLEIPFSEAVLEQSKDTHVLVAVFPLSILEIRGKVKRELFFSHEDAWYNKQSFAKEHGEISWQLVRKTPVDDSTSKNWQEQQALLSKDDEMPSAQVMVYTIIGHYLATGERLFEHIYVRTSSVDSDGDRVLVGYFDSDGLVIYGWWDDGRDDFMGVSSARKF